MINRSTQVYELRCDDNYRGSGGQQQVRIPIPRASNIAVAVLLDGGSWVNLDISWCPAGGPPQAFSPAVQLTTGTRGAKLAADELIGADELLIKGATTSAGHSCNVYVTTEVETSPVESPREVGTP